VHVVADVAQVAHVESHAVHVDEPASNSPVGQRNVQEPALSEPPVRQAVQAVAPAPLHSEQEESHA